MSSSKKQFTRSAERPPLLNPARRFTQAAPASFPSSGSRRARLEFVTSGVVYYYDALQVTLPQHDRWEIDCLRTFASAISSQPGRPDAPESAARTSGSTAARPSYVTPTAAEIAGLARRPTTTSCFSPDFEIEKEVLS